jgi:hypothetical protein
VQGSLLHVPQRRARVQRGGDEHVPEGVGSIMAEIVETEMSEDQKPSDVSGMRRPLNRADF